MSFEHPLGRFGHAPQSYPQTDAESSYMNKNLASWEESETMAHELHHVWQEAAHSTFTNGSPVYPQWFHDELGVPNQYQERSPSIRPGMNSGEVRGDTRFVYQDADNGEVPVLGPDGWEAYENYKESAEGSLRTAIGGVILLTLLVVAFS